ncbi:MAG: YbjN domain-containing protein [Gemmobacter sp.]
MNRFLAAIAVLATVALPAPMAGAQVLLDATNPAQIAQAIVAHGYRAQLETGQSGDPLIRSSAEGINFTLFFYGCNQGKDCRSIRYSTNFRVNPAPTVEKINEWNNTKTIGMAAVTPDGLARLGHHVALSGGVSEANLRASYDLWRAALRQYAEFVGFKR